MKKIFLISLIALYASCQKDESVSPDCIVYVGSTYYTISKIETHSVVPSKNNAPFGEAKIFNTKKERDEYLKTLSACKIDIKEQFLNL